MYLVARGVIYGGGGAKGRSPPESVFKKSIIRVCEIHIIIFFNVDYFITKSNYAWLLNWVFFGSILREKSNKTQA
jgi:hypothetical protein